MYACLPIGMNVCPNAAGIVNAIIYGVLTAIGLLGVAVLMFIRSAPSKPKHEKMVSGASHHQTVQKGILSRRER